MADAEPRAGELTTANYGWTKPNVGNSDDAWGGMLNADLDGIDTTVKAISTVANAAYPAANPSGYQTAANVTASLAPYALTASVPVASSTAPVMDGIAAVGVGTTWARADHVHPIATQVMGDNRIINGDMRIDQRNNGASGTANSAYLVDRWQYYGAQASKGSWGRNLSGQSGPGATAGFPYCLGFQSSSAYTPLAGDVFEFFQPIEADAVSDFMWGTAGAQSVTLSFWVLSSLTGTFGGSLANYGPPTSRAYPFTYSIPAATTWTKIVITVPGDTAGSWVLSGNGGSVYVQFDLGCGANSRAPAGAWVTGNLVGANGGKNVVATNGATFYVTGVKLEVGSVATPFNRQTLAKSMADCQRYYEALNGGVYAVGPTSATGYVLWPFKVIKRATPTIVNATYDNTVVAAGAIGLDGTNFTRSLGNFTLLTGAASAEL